MAAGKLYGYQSRGDEQRRFRESPRVRADEALLWYQSNLARFFFLRTLMSF